MLQLQQRRVLCCHRPRYSLPCFVRILQRYCSRIEAPRGFNPPKPICTEFFMPAASHACVVISKLGQHSVKKTTCQLPRVSPPAQSSETEAALFGVVFSSEFWPNSWVCVFSPQVSSSVLLEAQRIRAASSSFSPSSSKISPHGMQPILSLLKLVFEAHKKS